MSEEIPFIDFINFDHENNAEFLKRATVAASAGVVRDRAKKRFNVRKLTKVAQRKDEKEHTKDEAPKKVVVDKFRFDDDDLFNEIDGIRVYTGMVRGDPEKYQESIDFYKAFSPNDVLMPLKSSTISVTGKISHIDINESEIIGRLLHPENRRILKIGSGGGQILQRGYEQLLAGVAAKKTSSRRGKKPTQKGKPSKGGGYFPSCVQFDILGDDGTTVFKIKLFRNGVVQIPGVKDSLMRDAIGPLQILRDYMRNLLEDPRIEVLSLTTNMRNYISQLRLPRLGIFVDRMCEMIETIKREYRVVTTAEMLEYWRSLEQYPHETAKRMFMAAKLTNIQINETSLNEEKRPGFYIKFNHPIKHKPDKQLTIKILKSGKIDFDGASHELEVQEMFHWVVFLLKTHWDYLVYDPSRVIADISSDSDHYPAIYDDEL